MALSGKFSEISSIRVLDKFTYSGVHSNLTPFHLSHDFDLVVGDITNPSDVATACKGIDAVINFAAESHVDKSIENSSEFIATNIDGVRVLMERCLKQDLKVVHVSTDEVYGSIEIGSWDEESPLKPNSPYAASKAAGDLIARSFFKTFGANVVTTRCSNNYGPNQFPEKLIPSFITKLLTGDSVPLYGTGIQIRDWLHVTDHCNGIALALARGDAGEVYNFGGGKELTNLELTRVILSKIGFGEEKIKYVEDRKGHDYRYSVSWKKAQIELGYEPVVSFDTGISETLMWYQDNTSWWKPLLV
jgi:dTDP-glucose 4,6-dehydratase